jgi:hypothetical protein
MITVGQMRYPESMKQQSYTDYSFIPSMGGRRGVDGGSSKLSYSD